LLFLGATLVVVLLLAGVWDGHGVPERNELSFSPPSGAYDGSQLLEIRPSRPRAPAIFTTDGTLPTAEVGALYERPLRLDSDSPGVTVVRARDFIDGVPGPVLSASYAVGVSNTLPILSIIAEPSDLWGSERGILANAWQRGQEWERPVHVTFFEGDGTVGYEIPAGLRIQPVESAMSGSGTRTVDQPKQSFKLYFRREYGAARLEYPLFPEHQQDIQSYKRLVLGAGDKSGRWMLLSDQLLAEIALEMDGYGPQGRFVLLFLNGEPWGIYRLSEQVDRFFLQDSLSNPLADLVQGGRTVQGDGYRWDTLITWLNSHDLSTPDSYAYLQTLIDLESLTNHAILQMFFGASGENLNAVRPQEQEGRWYWVLGNGAHELGSVQDAPLLLLQPSARPSDLHLLLGKLVENADYRAFLARRAADLLNTSLSPEKVGEHIDQLASQLRPDIGYETTRWPTVSGLIETQHPGDDKAEIGAVEWERNVDALRASSQRRPDAVRQQLVTAFDLRGTTPLTFSVSGEGGGFVVVDGWPASDLPWSGTYFLDSELRVIAVPEPGSVFQGWDDCSTPACQVGPAGTSAITLTVDGPRSYTARFVPVSATDSGPRPNDVIINEYWINDNGTRYASIGGESIEGDWLELLVTRPGTVDLRGWRITDNNTKTSTSEGSIILPSLDVFSAVPRSTAILIIVTQSSVNEARFPRDDLDPSDGQMVLYVGNGHLDVTTDPGFNIGPGDDNLVLLAPGPSSTLADDIGVDFVAEGNAVTPLKFGVLADGVIFDAPFQRLGNDDGVVFTRARNNDHGEIGWIVDPAPTQSGDDSRLAATNILSPGALNDGQNGLTVPADLLGVVILGLIGAVTVLWLRFRHGYGDLRRKTGR
jgi:hypothetical protein